MGEFYGPRWTKGKRPEVLIAVKKDIIARLFEVKISTIEKWQSQRKLNLRSLESICELYHQRRLSGKI